MPIPNSMRRQVRSGSSGTARRGDVSRSSIVPAQKRPRRSHLPSFMRLCGMCASVRRKTLQCARGRGRRMRSPRRERERARPSCAKRQSANAFGQGPTARGARNRFQSLQEGAFDIHPVSASRRHPIPWGFRRACSCSRRQMALRFLSPGLSLIISSSRHAKRIAHNRDQGEAPVQMY